MSQKNSITTAAPLEWSKALSIIKKLEQDGQPVWALLVCSGCFTGLRITDLLRLKYEQLYGESLVIIEMKTGKTRTIAIHPTLRELAERVGDGREGYIFTNRKGHIYTRQWVNTELHKIAAKYKIKTNFSSHALRKTMSRRVFEANGESDRSLIVLSQMLRHSNIAVTRRYIGLEDREIQNIYMNL